VIDAYTSNVIFGEKIIKILHELAVELTWTNSFNYVDEEIVTIIKLAAKQAKMNNLKSVTVEGIWKAIDYAHDSESPKKSPSPKEKGLGKWGKKVKK
jgi:hypothetical protein